VQFKNSLAFSFLLHQVGDAHSRGGTDPAPAHSTATAGPGRPTTHAQGPRAVSTPPGASAGPSQVSYQLLDAESEG
jgi:hypothetical protein